MTSDSNGQGYQEASSSVTPDPDFEEGAQKLNNLLGTFNKPKPDVQESDTQSVDLSTEKSRFVIIHYTPSKMLWDWLVLSLTTYTAVVVPLVAAFQLTPRSTAWLVVDSILDVFFLVDMGVNFHTTYIGQEGTLVTNLNRIRLRYARSWFIIDVLACLPYDAINVSIGEVKEKDLAHLLGALKAFRLLRIIRIARDVDRYLEHAWASLLVMLSLILLICHWMACGWYAVSIQGVSDYLLTYAKLEEELRLFLPTDKVTEDLDINEFDEFSNSSLVWNIPEDYQVLDGYQKNVQITPEDYDKYNASVRLPPKSWLLTYGENLGREFHWNVSEGRLKGGPNAKVCYTACLYFAMTNVISAGFGNIAGETTLEKVYCIFILTLGGILYAAILGNVTNILQQFNAHNHEFLENIKAVRDFATLHELPKQLTESICDYMTYTRVATHGVNVDKILNYLPEHKRAEVCVHLHRFVLSSQEVFRDLNENERSIVARTFQRGYAAPGDIVCDRGELIDTIFFIISGSIEVTYDGAVVAILSKGDSFGINIPKTYTYTTEPKRSEACVRALTYVDVDQVTTQDLLDTMKTFPRMDVTFRRKWRITYDLQKTFAFRTVEAVQWQREEETNPETATKFNRLRKWLRKTQRRKERRALDEETPPEVETTSQETDRKAGSSAIWDKVRKQFIAVVIFIRSYLGDVFASEAQEPNNSDLQKIIPNAESIAVVNESETQERVPTADVKPLKKVKVPKCTATGKKLKCCQRCGKPVKKKNVDFNVESCEENWAPCQPKSKQVVVKSNNAATRKSAGSIKTGSLIPETVVVADVYEPVDDQTSKWQKSGEISFTLESRGWQKMRIHPETKRVLNCVADFKTDVANELLQIESKISKNEKLLCNILRVVSDESFVLPE